MLMVIEFFIKLNTCTGNVNIVDLLSPPYDSEFDGGSGF